MDLDGMDEVSSASSRYSHKPLPSTSHIRLFSLDPRKSALDPLSGSFSICSVADAPQYNALSYAPGDESVREEVWVDAVATISVPQSLHRAMRDLPTDRTFTIWVEAICVNKADTLERNAHARLARNIYSNSHNVLAWIGDKIPSGGWTFSASTGKASTSLRKLSARNPQKDAHLKDVVAKFPYTYQVRVGVEPGDFLSLKGAEKMVEDVLRHPSLDSDWPTHVWALPHVALSRSCIVYWSGESLYWAELAYALSNMSSLTTSVPAKVFRFLKLEEMRSRLHVHAPKLADGSPTIKAKYPLVYHPVEWPHALTYVSGLESKTTREKIYAAVNLLVPTEAELFAPDYSEDTRGLLIRLTSEMITQYGPGFLAHVDHNRDVSRALARNDGLEDLPSWVPDFTDKSCTSQNTRRFWQAQLQDVRLPITPPTDAVSHDRQSKSRKVLESVSFSGPPQHPTLEVLGSIDETVAIAGANNDWLEMRGKGPDTIPDFITILKQWIALLEEIGPDMHLDALHALFGAKASPSNNGRDDRWELLRDQVRATGGWRRMQRIAATNAAMEKLDSSAMVVWNYDDEGDRITDSEATRAMLEEWQQVTRERRLVITEEGYVGFAPADTRVGDVLVLFDMSEMRFVMRREGERWRLIGSCYLQRKPLLKQAERQQQKFVIC